MLLTRTRPLQEVCGCTSKRLVIFEKGKHVILCVPKQSKSLKNGLTPKILPQFCGPFKILKRVGKVAYKLDLPSTSTIHLAFHVNCLRKQLYN